MGVEVAAIASALAKTASSFAGINNAQREAKAKVAEGNIAAEDKARQVRMKAAAARSSFLTSGLTLEGTPLAAIDDIFTVGLADMNQMRKNTDVAARGIVGNARTKALESAASTLTSMDFGNVGGSIRTVGTPDQQIDFGDYFSRGARSDISYAQKGGFGPYRF